MRTVQDETYRQFSEWLLRIGTDYEPHDDHDLITPLQEIITESLQDMINFVYPPTLLGHHQLMQNPLYKSERC